MKVIVNENQRGLLFKDGVFVDYLVPGKHRRLGKGYHVQLLQTDSEFVVPGYSLDVFSKNQALSKEISTVKVADNEIALHFVNEKYENTLPSGQHAFFEIYDHHTYRIIDTTNVEIGESIPRHLFDHIPHYLYTRIDVASFEKGRLYYDGTFIKLLEPGVYYFWENGIEVMAELVDTRSLQLEILGQEIMTLDKVMLRINFVCTYKISDYIRIHTEIDDYERQLYVLLQLALREYVGKYRLDEILENKEQLSTTMLAYLKGKETEFFVIFSSAGVKDIILPGEVRDIMNTVLIAEKRAQANVISRREEVASTRSLLNTAKLMDENQTLYKLKELEYMEKICENVGSISVSGGADLLTQLSKVLKAE